MYTLRTRFLAALAGIGLLVPVIGHSQQVVPLSPRALARPAPVADTRLLMEALANNNFKALEKMLKGKPEDAEAWTFARGQALLIAETGNLLLMRPPKSQGQDIWNRNSVELRDAATRLARAIADADLNNSRARLIEVSNACNKCHQSFGQKTRLAPFQEDVKPPQALPPQ